MLKIAFLLLSCFSGSQAEFDAWQTEIPAIPQGAVKLDSLTLDRAIAMPGVNWLVLLDRNYTKRLISHAHRTGQMETFCEHAKDVKDLLIGKIPVQQNSDRPKRSEEHGTALQNDALRKQLDVELDDLPTFFLYKDGRPIRFNGKGSGKKIRHS